MKKIVQSAFFLLAAISFPGTLSAQWIWAKKTVDREHSIAVDASGNIYQVGAFWNATVTIGSTTLQNTSAGHSDIFIVKYDANGNVIWAKNEGGTDDDVAYSIVVDGSGNSYVTGNFRSAGMTIGSSTLTNTNLGGVDDIFVAKYDNNGNPQWANCGGGTYYDYASAVATDASGNVFIAGSFSSPSINFGAATLTNTSNNYSDIFLVKYDSSGNLAWAKSAGSATDDGANALAVDGAGNVIIAGQFGTTTITFGTVTLTSAGSTDVFVARYDTNGNVLWAKGAGGTNNDGATCVATDISGKICVTGVYASSGITFGTVSLVHSGNPDFFLVQFDSNGNALWAKGATGNGAARPSSLTTDGSGNIYVTGNFQYDAVMFGLINLALNPSQPLSFSDLFLLKYGSNGSLVWATSTGGDADDIAQSIASDGTDVYISGWYDSSVLPFGQDTLLYGLQGGSFLTRHSILTGIETNSSNTSISISVFPNPFSNTITIENSFTKNLTIEIFNSLGQQVYREENVNEKTVRVNLNDRPNGIYFVQAISEKEIYSVKVVKQ